MIKHPEAGEDEVQTEVAVADTVADTVAGVDLHHPEDLPGEEVGAETVNPRGRYSSRRSQSSA